MATHEFDVDEFREQFPAFADEDAFPDATLQQYWNAATCYITPVDFCWLQNDCLQLALNLMTAHLTALSALIAQGQTPGYEQSATIDKISVTLTPPPNKNQWQWWLSTTPYGMQLLALLQAKSAGGFYIGGLPETAAFRKVGGIYA